MAEIVSFTKFVAALNLPQVATLRGRRHIGTGRWTDESSALLERRWKDKAWTVRAICEEIDAEFGWLPQRNAVIGKAKRMGYGPKPKLGRTNKSRPRLGRRPKRKVIAIMKVPRIVNNEMTLIELMIKEEDRELAAFNAAIPKEQRKQLWEMENEHCRYAVGDVGTPTFFFCAAPEADVIGGHPYCLYHQQVCWAGIPARKAARRAA